MNNSHRLILASGSKVRADLLRSVGVEFETQVSDFDERAYESTIASLPLALQAVELAQQKALSVSNQCEGAFVIGADQICEIGETALTKPQSKEDAVRQLDALSGRTHYQHSGVCIVWDSQVIWSHCETASLTMRDLSRGEKQVYLKLDEPYDACGSYHFEGHGRHLFSKVEGDHDAILGLPLVPLLNALHKKGCISLS